MADGNIWHHIYLNVGVTRQLGNYNNNFVLNTFDVFYVQNITADRFDVVMIPTAFPLVKLNASLTAR